MRKSLVVGAAALLTLAGTVLTSSDAEARWRGGGFRGGGFYGGGFRGFYGGGFRGVNCVNRDRPLGDLETAARTIHSRD